jgi:hypothetical protein
VRIPCRGCRHGRRRSRPRTGWLGCGSGPGPLRSRRTRSARRPDRDFRAGARGRLWGSTHSVGYFDVSSGTPSQRRALRARNRPRRPGAPPRRRRFPREARRSGHPSLSAAVCPAHPAAHEYIVFAQHGEHPRGQPRQPLGQARQCPSRRAWVVTSAHHETRGGHNVPVRFEDGVRAHPKASETTGT